MPIAMEVLHHSPAGMKLEEKNMPSPFMSTFDSQFVSDSGAMPPIDGLGISLNVDVSGGVFGGLTKRGGWIGVPYIPATPLGALVGLKGDLVIPIVIIGVGTFLLLLIVKEVDFGCSGMELHGHDNPWAGELRARNRKVARNIWSTSDLSDLESQHRRGWGRSFSEEKEMKVIDPVKLSSTTNSIVAKASLSSVAKTTMRTEKAAPMRMRRDRDVSIEETSDAEIKSETRENMTNGMNGSGEESILEYGPGIVRKLRSKYQSLALRQIALRPSLRRSASLENGLDLDSETVITPTSTPEPLPSPRVPDRVLPPVPPESTRTRAFRSNMTLNINDGTNFSRGRSEVNRRARMTRARSVDALHRVERTPLEEEILEKFKTVVEPREEVVIIEVLKPRRNLGIGNANNCSQASSPLANTSNSTLHDKVECYNANTNVNVNANGKPTGVGEHSTGSSDSQLGRGRTLASPEYELPPADIVKETARIFETNPAGSHWKLLARHALTSASVSPISSPSSPTPVPTLQQITTSNVSIVANPEIIQNGHVMSSSPICDIEIKQQLNNNGKQIGVIRPTVNGVSKSLAPLKIIKNSSGIGSTTVNVNITETNNKIATASARLLSNSNNNKPPLSPKPIFISHSTKNQFNGNFKGVESSKRTTELKEAASRINRSPSPDSQHKPKQNQSVNNSNNKSKNVPLLNGNGLTVLKESESLNNSKVNHFPVTLKPINTKSTKAENLLVQQQRNVLNGNVNVSVSNCQSNPANSTIGQQLKLSNNVKDPGSVAATTTTKTMSAKDLKSSGKDVENNNEGVRTKDGKESTSGDADRIPVQTQQSQSQLRTHQKQKFSEQQNGGGGSIVFNFTKSRNKVPDYIEDDGLHRNQSNGSDDSVDDVDSIETEKIDPKFFQFTGANVIINGKSSIQKKPKSQKMSIKFNESGPTTFEYPSESSILTGEDSESSKDNLLGQKTPNLINGNGGGGGLGSYTPSKQVSSLYQLGSYKERLIESNNKKSASEERLKAKEDMLSNGDIIEDYLKPDTESTTWSNEIGAADILF